MLVGADIEELVVALLADLDAVPTALELLAKAADVFAGVVENEDRRMIFQLLAPLVDDIDIGLGIHSHIVRGLPGELIGQLQPVVQHLVTMLALAGDHGPVVSLVLGAQQQGPGGGGG